MLAPANEALSSPCLPAAFRDAYGPWAFLFATVAMMGMHLVDFLVKVSASQRFFAVCGVAVRVDFWRCRQDAAPPGTP